jgi:hypothetical protein
MRVFCVWVSILNSSDGFGQRGFHSTPQTTIKSSQADSLRKTAYSMLSNSRQLPSPKRRLSLATRVAYNFKLCRLRFDWWFNLLVTVTGSSCSCPGFRPGWTRYRPTSIRLKAAPYTVAPIWAGAATRLLDPAPLAFWSELLWKTQINFKNV